MYTYVYYIYNITIHQTWPRKLSPPRIAVAKKKKTGVRTIWGQAARVTLKAPFRWTCGEPRELSVMCRGLMYSISIYIYIWYIYIYMIYDMIYIYISISIVNISIYIFMIWYPYNIYINLSWYQKKHLYICIWYLYMISIYDTIPLYTYFMYMISICICVCLSVCLSVCR